MMESMSDHNYPSRRQGQPSSGSARCEVSSIYRMKGPRPVSRISSDVPLYCPMSFSTVDFCPAPPLRPRPLPPPPPRPCRPRR